MSDEEEIKMPKVSTSTTSGLVSVLQLVDTTPSEMFATVRNDTSGLEIQRITYSPIELPKKEASENMEIKKIIVKKIGKLEERLETAIASETSLGKDWLRPEEDEAWQDL